MTERHFSKNVITNELLDSVPPIVDSLSLNCESTVYAHFCDGKTNYYLTNLNPDTMIGLGYVRGPIDSKIAGFDLNYHDKDGNGLLRETLWEPRPLYMVGVEITEDTAYLFDKYLSKGTK